MTSLTHKLFNKVDGRSIGLLLTLGSGQVSVALVYKDNQEKPQILQTRSKNVPFDHNPTPVELQKNVLAVLDVLLADFIQELGGMFELNDLYDSHQAIHQVDIALSPLWITTEITTHEEVFDTPTKITHDILQSYINQEEADGVIDASVVFARANKYRVHPEDIVGMETPEIEVQIKKSMLSERLQEQIESTITSHISIEKTGSINYVPSQKVAIATVAELFGAHTEYTVIHIDGEDSHIVTHHKEVGMKSDSISYGIAELKRQLIKEGLAPDFVHARDLLRAYFAGDLEDSLKERIDYVLSIESQVLANLTGDFTAEKTPLFVIADSNSEDFFTRYVVRDLEHITNALAITPEHFTDYFTTTGLYIQPSVELCALVTYNDMLKTAQ